MHEIALSLSIAFDVHNLHLAAKTRRNAQLLIICAAIASTLSLKYQRHIHQAVADADTVRYLFNRLSPPQQKRVLSLLHASRAEEFVNALKGGGADRLILLVAAMLSRIRKEELYSNLISSVYQHAPRTLLFTAMVTVWLISGYKGKPRQPQVQPQAQAQAQIASPPYSSPLPANHFARKAYRLAKLEQEWLLSAHNGAEK
ncbi:MAG: hypothetical protein QXS54_00880 [Candidatus Methanomethylicaceae archaeon]